MAEAKRHTVQRKRKACKELRDLMVDIGIEVPEDLPPHHEWKKQSFTDVAKEVSFGRKGHLLRFRSICFVACSSSCLRIRRACA